MIKLVEKTRKQKIENQGNNQVSKGLETTKKQKGLKTLSNQRAN